MSAPDAPAPRAPLGLFEAYGIELEYMIVARDTLRVLPVADEVLRAVTGGFGDKEDGPIAWSNELVLHVIELKTNGPTPTLVGRDAEFLADLRRIDAVLAPLGGMLLPTAMHPTMDPLTETRLWPHEQSPVYEAYDRIFSCKGHGWANLQSMHVNLPFAGDAEFGVLHAAIRFILPLLPALAASSPFMDGQATGRLDNRLAVYKTNQARIPIIAGRVVPERADSQAAYRRDILERIWRDIAPYDPDGLLQREFLNSRGAIARFERDAIEIRVLDLQEGPASDLAIAHLVTEALKLLVFQRFAPLDEIRAFPLDPLAAMLDAAIILGDETPIDDGAYLALWGYPGARATMGELWRHIAGEAVDVGDANIAPLVTALGVILERGPLSRRILRATGPRPDEAAIMRVYRSLAEHLMAGQPFVG